MLFKNMKKSSSFLMILGILSIFVVAAYAASLLFFNSESQTSNYSKKDLFEFVVNDFFTESGGFGPGESKGINPIVTSNASIDSYVVIVAEMPKYGSGNLYTINISDDWSLLESWTQGNSRYEAYQYGDALSAGASTTALGNRITMADMTNAQYGQLENLNVSMTAYVCGADEGENLDSAWSTIKTHFQLGE